MLTNLEYGGTQGVPPGAGSGDRGTAPGQQDPPETGTPPGGQEPTAPGTATDLLPSVSAPKGGGAIRGLGEKFAVNAATGTASMTVPIPLSPGRSGFTPALALSYDSGAGNGPLGFGWGLGAPAITRKTDKGLPQYLDAQYLDPESSDVYILAGAEDLVPVLDSGGGQLKVDRTVFGTAFVLTFYRPRIEGLYSRIEQWTAADTGISHWRTISRDNVTTLYGADPGSRVANPANPAQVFSWQISQAWDDKGNAACYSYLPEDSAGIDTSAAHEANRTPAGRAAQIYLKSVSYGNLQPYLPDWTAQAAPPLPLDWAFTMVLDYGDHGATPPGPQADQPWPLRPDPFSTYRARFEVRTYRRVRRLLFFHDFPGEVTAGPDLLVRSLDLVYADQQAPPDPSSAVYSLLVSVTQCGYRQDAQAGLVTRSLPPLELTYSQPRLGQEILTLDSGSQANLPEGLDDASFRWVDLDGEGLSGILAAGGDGGWYYKRNLSAANLAVQPDGSQIARASFGPAQAVAALPSRSDLSGVRLLDLSGSGRLDVVDLAGPDPGYFERDDDGGFAPLQRFAALPALDYASANVTFIDVTGDGLADILLTEDGLYTVHASLCGDAGYDVAVQVRPGWDEERGPSVVLADGSQTIFTADMSGDGLSDIVRIRNGEACYWPNTGYGTFGAKVTMDGAPRFDSEERFDPHRVLLADIDGTGTADLLYAGEAGITAWFSQSGNSWSAPVVTGVFPSADRLGSLQALDLLGTGTACLVWSSPLPSQAVAPLRYVDLMSGAKPHLLTGAVNNLGAETRVSYAPATQFYVADELAGTPWLTRLPFPVQVVRRTETIDWIGRGRQVCQYAYHHGYFDGYEREFRGFGMVEQTDTEELRDDTVFDDGDALNWDQQSWSPPMLTRTWYHTGAFTQAGAVSQGYAAAFWTEPALRAPGRQADAAAMLLPETVLPETVLPDRLDALEAQEAYRALKGHALRTEVYALDGSAQQGNPYTVTEQNYTLTLVQAMGVNPHAVLAVAPRESVTFRYDRGPDDPQVGHDLVLQTDGYGNIERKITAGYPRRAGYPPPEPSLSAQVQQALAYDQGRLHVTGTQYGYTNAIDDLATWPDAYRAPLPAATDTAELTGTAPSVKGTGITSRFSFDEIDGTAGVWDTTWTTAADVPFEAVPGSDVDGTGSPATAPTRRFTAQTRTVYRGDDLAALLTPGQLQPLALTGESYQAALTPGLLTAIFGTVLAGPALATALAQGGYVQLAGETSWWRPSGRVYYSHGDSDTPAQELAYAGPGFFLPCRAVDPFGGISRADYDGYYLLTKSVTDQVGNVTSAASDYRVLAPATVTDPNGNRAACAYDALGLVTATAAMGKTTESLGDLLTGFTIDLDSTTLLAQFADPLAGPAAVLGSATSRSLYDVGAYQRTAGTAQPQPPAAYTLSRQLRVSDLASPPYRGAPTSTGYAFAFAYSDGLGRVIQKKAQAAPGPVADGGPAVSPRWAGSGWTIYDNKQRPVRVFEPFFSATNGFEFAAATGAATVTFYDPPGRVAARLYPDSSWDKTVFGPWLEQRWDRDDTVLITDPRTDLDVGGYFTRVLPAGPFSTWYELRIGGSYGATAADQAAWRAAAQQAAKAAATPATAHADSLGRACLTVADNGGGDRYPSRTARDTQGTPLAVTDPLGRRSGEFVLRQAVTNQPYLAGTDMAGAQLYHVSADGGARRGLPAVTGAMIRSYDARGHAFRLTYDQAQRPVARYVATGGGPEALTEMSVYGEGQQAANLCGREFRHYDPSGYLENSAFDYAGNLTATLRQLAAGYQATPDWTPLAGLTAAAALDAAATTAGLIPAGGGQDAYAASTSYDALNRATQLVMPHNTAMLPDVLQPGYDEALLLTTMDTWLQQATAPAALLDPATATMRAVTSIEYNARGQRASIGYGNGAVSAYAYDPQTFRLAQLTTTRPTTLPANQRVVQALAYYYDPMGNITTVADSADTQDVIYFSNQRVDPTASYGYDPLYRLTSATGREHLGQTGTALSPPQQVTSDDSTRMGLPQPGDGNAMGNYTESYTYDAAGNLLTMAHLVSSGNWTRRYGYAEPSQIDPTATGSRLSASSLPGDPAAGPYSADYSYDAHGNMTVMPQLAVMTWDADDRLLATARQAATSGTAQTTYYSCAGHGQRIRKVTDRQAATGQQATRKSERIYLGGIEVYREYATDGVTVTLERQTLRIADGSRPVALIETRTSGTDPAPQQQVRYQHGNHLDSAALELDDTAQIISYEEYFPFGATSYQAVSAQVDVPKRYRFTGKERDAENDLYYHGARYYAPWLGRWTACDPVTSPAGLTPYGYAACNPVRLTDPDGRDPVPGQDRDEGVAGDRIGQPGTPGRRTFPHLPALRLTLSPANFWYSSMSQGSGIMDPGSMDVEAGALGMAGRTTGLNLRNPAGNGGLSTGVLAVRAQVQNVPGLDIGLAGTGSYIAQGQTSVTPADSSAPTTAPATAQASGAALVTAHYGAQHVFRVDWLSAAGYLTAGYQHAGQTGQHDIDAGTVQFLGAVGYEHDPPGPPEHFRLSDPPANPNPPFLSALMLNPVISYTSAGSLSQGPPLTNIFGFGGIASVGVGFGRSFGLTAEGSLTRTWGSAMSGSDQAAASTAERIGLIGTYNYADRTTDGRQTSSVSVGIWYGHESGTITGTPTATAPTGNWDTNSIFFGVIFGYRRSPH